MVHYIIPIADKKHYLQLLLSTAAMLSPSVVITVHDDKGISQREVRKLGNSPCHYTGAVMRQEDSQAALPTCYGFSGYTRTNRGYFIIEPVAGYNLLSENEHPHLLFQHDKNPPVMKTNCITTGNLAKILAKKKPPKNTTSGLHIEAMVVLNKILLDYHKEINVENYALTVFNMAHHLYHDAPLGVNINLAIVRMIRLEEEENRLNLAVNRNVRKTLQFLRDWQQKMNPSDDTHPNHHDVAVFLTRIDICGDDRNCGILGASVLAGICESKQQAALCKNNGLCPGFVIVHEVADAMGIPHDTPTESGTCLYDPPTDYSFEMPDILPGIVYRRDFQILRPNAALCDTGIKCQNLICYMEDKGVVEGEPFIHKGIANDSKTKLLDIPVGAVNIKIEETKPSEAKIEVGSKDGKVMYIQWETYGLVPKRG
ncbi:hypothetical protein ILUMI_12237 [Ignelater luminosus]|uniref:Peptidase M12B domain-containing protein n=1 Tax=Ignelater luminosus TaxID=2038154 RepID=A0A8K0D3A1_IGNLU|nr:hypothetical protein ILUMI_12237 [Ignelater luminosus]